MGASALCAAAPTAGALVAARGFQAVGAAVLIPTSLALVLAELRPRRVGVWGVASTGAAATAPPWAASSQHPRWAWIFLVNLPVGLAACWAVGRRVLHESRDRTRARRARLVAGGRLRGPPPALGVVEGQG